MNSDDLLSFKEYPPIHDNYARGGGVAEININSPNRNFPMANQFSDQHLQDLTNDMNLNQGLAIDAHQQAPNGKIISINTKFYFELIGFFFYIYRFIRRQTISNIFIFQHRVLSTIFQC